MSLTVTKQLQSELQGRNQGTGTHQLVENQDRADEVIIITRCEDIRHTNRCVA